MAWSNEQLDAIKSFNRNELINAGAGSGKTAVLSEHVLHLLKHHDYELKDFLIVTFTNDAANEMKQRIRSKLLNDKDLSRFVDQIESAHIETFDAFYLFLVNKYAHVLNLKPGIQILDQCILKVELKNVIENLFASLYKSRNEEFIDLVTHLGVKDDKDVKEAIVNLYDITNKVLNDESYLENYFNNFYSDDFIISLVNDVYNEIIERINVLISMANDLEVKEDADVIIESVSSLLENKTYDDLYNALINYTLPRNNYGKFYSSKKPRNDINDLMNKKIRGVVKGLGDKETVINNYINNKKYAKIIVKLTQNVKKEINSYKQKYNMFEFIDISRFAIKLMEQEDIAKEVKQSFKYIMIDEYQDTNDIQERMISLLGNNNVFMVGDVKQSIYRFNNSNCDIFESKYQKYKQEIDGHKIDMTKNYRSRPEFLNDLNKMFALLMSKNHNPISYIDGHKSGFGNEDYSSLVDKKLDYGIKGLTYDIESFEMPGKEIEASLIAEDIIKKINNKVEVYDKNHKCLRVAKFSDFAIIIDRGTDFDTFKTIFNKYKIPLFIQNDETILYSDISLVVKNLLVLVDCVKQDIYDEKFIHSYVSIARSFIKQYEDSFIYQKVKDGSYIFDDIVCKIRDMNNAFPYQNLRSTLVNLYDIFEIEKKIICLGDINNNIYYFDYLISVADNFDSLHKQLKDFIEFFDVLMNADISMKSAPYKDIDNSVLLINIHKSKGREFPICYFPLINKRFNFMEFNKSLYMHKNYGMSLKPLIKDDHASLNKFVANIKEVKADVEEKIRLFYVALTRARESAIIVYPNDIQKKAYRMADSKTIYDILSFAPLSEGDIKCKNELNGLAYKGNENNESQAFILKQPKTFEHVKIEKKRASKTIDNGTNLDALKFGKKLHYLLELVDFSTKNVDFIKNDKERMIIQNVISNELFSVNPSDKVLHEYSYYDEVNDVNGIIDCLIIREDEIDIIDFKLKNISDEDYDSQLLTYKKYISQINSGKKIRMYLLSIINNEIREVKDE